MTVLIAQHNNPDIKPKHHNSAILHSDFGHDGPQVMTAGHKTANRAILLSRPKTHNPATQL